jgi:hypothetical protein
MIDWYSNCLAVLDFAPILAENWWEKPGPFGIPMGMLLLFFMFHHNQKQRQSQQTQSPSAEIRLRKKTTNKKSRTVKKTAQNKPDNQKPKQNLFVPPKVTGNRCSMCGGEVKDWNGKLRCLACGTLHAK